MRIPLLLVAALFSVVTTTAQAAPYSFAEDSGWHYTFSGAMAIPSDADISINGGNLNYNGNGDYEYEVGFAFMTAIGYHWQGLRLEAEYSLRQTQSDDFNGRENFNSAAARAFGIYVPDPNQSLDMSFNSFMINLAYDLSLSKEVFIYFGGGLGLAIVSLDRPDASSTELEFAYQALVGIGYNLSENVALTLGYRIYTTTDTEFSEKGYHYDVDIPWMHHAELGIRYNF